MLSINFGEQFVIVGRTWDLKGYHTIFICPFQKLWDLLIRRLLHIELVPFGGRVFWEVIFKEIGRFHGKVTIFDWLEQRSIKGFPNTRIHILYRHDWLILISLVGGGLNLTLLFLSSIVTLFLFLFSLSVWIYWVTRLLSSCCLLIFFNHFICFRFFFFFLCFLIFAIK